MKKLILFFTLIGLQVMAQAQTNPVMLVVDVGSNEIAAGMNFTASIRLVNTTYTHVEYRVSGMTLAIDSTGAGVLKFKVGAGVYDKNGESKQSKEVLAIYMNDGKEKTIKGKIEYVVKKPTIVTNADLQFLYEGCGNTILVTVPELKESYNPAFNVSGCSVIKGAMKGEIIVLPVESAKGIEINVSSNGTMVGKIPYKVIKPPLPAIQVKIDSVTVTSLQTIEIKSNTVIRIKVVADSGFAKLLPKDAGYRMAEWTCVLIRDQKIIHTETIVDTPEQTINNGYNTEERRYTLHSNQDDQET